MTITQTCVWVVYFNYTQQHLAYFNTCLFQDFLPLPLSVRVKVRVTFHAPSPSRERAGVRVAKLLNLNKLNILMSSGRGNSVYFFFKELNNCRIKSINVAHTQARTIITLLNFLQAQSTSPIALCAVGFGFFPTFRPHFIRASVLWAVINCFALYSEAGSLPRLKLRTAYAFHAFPRLLR